ncbi:MAG: hypothetical protein CMQ20_16840 [Gammaproteobacteria bacterium]|jgi:hypothetical protein|nr:hypothetical protein [Gammaproteobacteria bacterium]
MKKALISHHPKSYIWQVFMIKTPRGSLIRHLERISDIKAGFFLFSGKIVRPDKNSTEFEVPWQR